MAAVMTFYRFVRLGDLPDLRRQLQSTAEALNLKGTVLLAEEGINATLAGESEALQAFGAALAERPEFRDLHLRFSSADPGNRVFHRMKVRIKTEIVRLDQPGVAPDRRTGEHVDARRWNALLEDPTVIVLDTRNDYEIGIGTFPGARNPGTRSFRQLPDYVREHLDPAEHPRVAMFCTGGIRCEKASAWMLEQGFEAVYQLEGGILNYLETVPAEENRWQGECFVFDQRVSVLQGPTAANQEHQPADLRQGSFEQCHACRRPLSAAELQAPEYQPGVSCPLCIDEHSETQRDGFRERHRQELLAARRGARHVGAQLRPQPQSEG